jgi:hypothetical protein
LLFSIRNGRQASLPPPRLQHFGGFTGHFAVASAFQFAAVCGSHYLIENRRGVTTLAGPTNE